MIFNRWPGVLLVVVISLQAAASLPAAPVFVGQSPARPARRWRCGIANRRGNG